jgi:hypothetical protein
MPMWPGWLVKVRVNNVAYKVSRVEINGTVPDGDATNSEGEPFSAGQVPGVSGTQDVEEFAQFPYPSTSPGVGTDEVVLVNATFDDAENRVDSPQLIKKGRYIQVEIRPIGLTGADAYRYPSMLVTEVRHEINVQKEAMQPVTIRCKQDGRGYRPGEVP